MLNGHVVLFTNKVEMFSLNIMEYERHITFVTLVRKNS